MHLEDRLELAGGVARGRELAHTRAERRELADAVLTGRVNAYGRGWYALPGAAPAAALAFRLNAVVSCVSAAHHYGLPVLRPDPRHHLSVPGSRGRPPASKRLDMVLHRETRGGVPAGEAPVVGCAEAVARALRCADRWTAIAMLDAALRSRVVEEEEIERLLTGPGSADARLRLAAADPRSRSVSESVARVVLRGAGLHVRAGVRVHGVGEVDLVVEDHVVVECDGFAYHSGRREFQEDRRRDRELTVLGYQVLRFTYHDVTDRPELVVHDVRRALRS